MTATWRNWGATARCAPASVGRPDSEAQIVDVVRSAAAAGRRVKAVGSGHSFTDIACTDGDLLDLHAYNRILSIDREKCQVTVESGISIWDLTRQIWGHGMSLPNQGDVAYQTVSGATSTATHGTGLKLRNLSTQICALTLVDGAGSVVRCAPDENADLFHVARVGLGALGIVSTVTIQCVEAFKLHAVETPDELDPTLDAFEDLIAANDHFEFYWFPHTEKVMRIASNRTSDPERPKGRVSGWVDDILLENHAFGMVQRLGRWRKAWIPGLARFTGSLLSRSETTDAAYRVFANERLVRFAEMEYALPRAAVPEALRAVRSMIERRRLRISFPIEVRAVAPDDIPLSTAYGRDTGYIAVHVDWKQPYEPYFREVEAIMDGYDGRPHWGKLHFQRAETLRPRYPEWDAFLAARDRLDPKRVFHNAYLERVLGG